MYAITMASLKGGAGKTTLALHLASAAEGRGIPTAVIDLDPQQAAAKWGDSRASGHPAVLSAMASRLSRAIEEAGQKGTHLVIIDTAAHAEGILTAAIDAADLVLIPCRPTVIDIQHLSATAQLIAVRRKIAAVVLNAVPARASELEQARTLVERLNVPIAPMPISNLVAYARSITASQGATEYEPGGKAAGEIRALLDWIVEHSNLSTNYKDDFSTVKQKVAR